MPQSLAVVVSLLYLVPTVAAVGLSVWAAVRWHAPRWTAGPYGAQREPRGGPAWSALALMPAGLALSGVVLLEAYGRLRPGQGAAAVPILPVTAAVALLVLGALAYARTHDARPRRPRGPATPVV